jgi:hypothetical protein
MRRRPSPLLRATRALTALITVWCLGCTGYEPLLSTLLGESAGGMMACGSVMGTAAADAVSPAGHGTNQAAVSDAAQSNHSFDCGCGSCHAAAPTQPIGRAPSSLPLALAQHEPSEPASLSRAPLLPPPQIAV